MINLKLKSMGKAMKRILMSLSQYINKMRIKKQLQTAYLVAVMLPVLLLGIYLVGNTRSLVMNQQISETRAENIRVENVLNELTDEVYNISNTMYYDSQLRDIITSQYPDEKSSVDACRGYLRIIDIVQTYSEISDIKVYAENGTIYNTGHFMKVTEDIRKAKWYQKASDNWAIHWETTTDPDGGKYLSLVRRIPTDNTNEKAVLVMNVSRSFLYSLVKGNPFKTVASVENGDIFLSNKYEDFGNPFGYVIPDGSKQDIKQIKLDGSPVLSALDVLALGTSDDTISIMTLNYDAIKHMNSVTLICCIILFFSIIVPFLIIFYFSNVFSKRINLLKYEMNKAASGNFETPSNPGGSDEISELYNDLYVMIDGVKSLSNEIYMEKLIKERMINSQQKIQFKMLASQINPHFLYNTLETIRMKLICNGDRETANVIKILGKTIRRMLEVRDKTVTLASELEYISYYLEIQRFRFGSRIDYEIKIGDDVVTKEYCLLPLLLQPIVENAFVHGLEDKVGGGKITIDIRKIGQVLQILVEDNGKGMTQEKCDLLNSAMKDVENSSAKNSIGLYNVHQRIALYYGQDYGVEIKSCLDAGTRVYIKLPSRGGIDSL